MRIAVVSASILLAALIVAGFFGALHPAFDSFAHFRAHLCVIAAIAGTLLTALRSRREGFSILVLALTAGATTAPTWWPANGENAPGGSFRILHANLRFDNDESDAALALLKMDAPDALLLTEVSDLWKAKLAAELPEWQFRVICPGRGKVGGAAILSRRPFLPSLSPQCHLGGGLAIASVDFAGKPLTLAEVHLHWPWPSRQMVDINTASAILGRLPASTLMAGDFNAAPWSWAVRSVAQAGKLKVLNGLGGTWSPSGTERMRWLGLPLDDVLHGDGLIAAGQAKRLPGSDHYAVSVVVTKQGS